MTVIFCSGPRAERRPRVLTWYSTSTSTNRHSRSGCILCNSATVSLPVKRSGTSYTPKQGSSIPSTSVALSLPFRFRFAASICFSARSRVALAIARGFSKATLRRSMGSPWGMYALARWVMKAQSTPPENRMASLASLFERKSFQSSAHVFSITHGRTLSPLAAVYFPLSASRCPQQLRQTLARSPRVFLGNLFQQVPVRWVLYHSEMGFAPIQAVIRSCRQRGEQGHTNLEEALEGSLLNFRIAEETSIYWDQLLASPIAKASSHAPLLSEP
jgi:hypothetical protein